MPGLTLCFCPACRDVLGPAGTDYPQGGACDGCGAAVMPVPRPRGRPKGSRTARDLAEMAEVRTATAEQWAVLLDGRCPTCGTVNVGRLPGSWNRYCAECAVEWRPRRGRPRKSGEGGEEPA